MAYVSVGDERIWVNTIQNDAERAVSPDYDNGYAFGPVFAPVGDYLAYLAGVQRTESQIYNIMVSNLNSAELIDLGRFENVYLLSWSLDGSSLVFSAGPYDQLEILAITIDDLEHRVLAEGRQPAWQPAGEQK